jgi:hypothetical protein
MPGMALFLLGVGTAILGMAMLLLKEFKFFKGEELKPLPRIVIGVILLSYFPLVFAVNPLIYDLNPLVSQIIQWGLWFFCLLLSGLVLMLATDKSRGKSRLKSRNQDAQQPGTFSGLNDDSNNPFRLS